MTDAEKVVYTLDVVGPLSDYGVYHAAKALGFKMTPSSARSRRAELTRAGKIRDTGLRELSSTGRKAVVWGLEN
jgi:hypothetical protein